ncbi:PadR family transcriptional regulator [Novosphingobium sp. ZN18A2]|uniref:PadR family transcriptional regulator n=1 Tax=Novosphingobium sp. ZN18A2 TaxID=3079861 RepID=UPI0030D0BA6C
MGKHAYKAILAGGLGEGFGMGPGFGGGRGGRGFGGGFGGGGFGGGRGGRGRKRMFASGELRLVLLRMVADESRHGYDLIKAIEEMTGGEYAPSPGVVYPTLSLLLDEGMIDEAEGEGARKPFVVTEAGRKELDERSVEADALLARLKAVAEESNRQASPPVRRAMGNLMAVLRNRAMAEGFDIEAAHGIADIIDDAARRIERL